MHPEPFKFPVQIPTTAIYYFTLPNTTFIYISPHNNSMPNDTNNDTDKTEDIYTQNHEQMIKRLMASFPKMDKEHIKNFIRKKEAEGVTMRRITKLLYCLKPLREQFLPNKAFENLTREDIEVCLGKINKSRYKDSTRMDYRTMLKMFMKHVRNVDYYPPEVAFITNKSKKCKEAIPEDTLSDDDIKALISSCDNTVDKLFISLHSELGSRIGEILPTKWKSIKEEKDKGGVQIGYRIKISGKTGYRNCLVIRSTSYINLWKAVYPIRVDGEPDPEGYVFVIQKKDGWRMMKYSRVRNMLSETAKKAGIKKKVNSHFFRISSATDKNRKGWSEAEQYVYHGWQYGSRSAKRYMQNRAEDADKRIKLTNGVAVEDEFKMNPAPIICKCGQTNGFAEICCGRCGQLLDQSKFEEHTRRQEVEELRMKKLEEELAGIKQAREKERGDTLMKLLGTYNEDDPKTCNPQVKALIETIANEMLKEHKQKIKTEHSRNPSGAIFLTPKDEAGS